MELADGTTVPYDGVDHRHRLGDAAAARPGGRGRSSTSCARSTTPWPCASASPTARPASSSSAPGSSGWRSPRRPAAKGCAVTVLEGLPAPLVRGLGEDMGRGHGRARRGRHRHPLRRDGHRAARRRRHAGRRLVRAGRCHRRRHRRRAGDGVAGGQRARAARRHRVRRDAGRRAAASSTRPVTSPAGRTRCSARRCASSTGRTPPSRARRRPQPAGEAGGGTAAGVRARAVLLERPGPPPDPVPRRGGDDGDGDGVEVVVGDPAEHRFLALYGRGDRLWGALGVNAPKLVMPYRRLLDERRELGRRAWR